MVINKTQGFSGSNTKHFLLQDFLSLQLELLLISSPISIPGTLLLCQWKKAGYRAPTLLYPCFLPSLVPLHPSLDVPWSLITFHVPVPVIIEILPQLVSVPPSPTFWLPDLPQTDLCQHSFLCSNLSKDKGLILRISGLSALLKALPSLSVVSLPI